MKKIGLFIIVIWATFVIWNVKAMAQITAKDFMTEQQIQLEEEAYKYEKIGEYDKAVQKYNQSCENYPDSFACLLSNNFMAEMYYKAGEVQKANQIIESQIAKCDREIKNGGESYYSALCLIMNSINYYSKKRYDDSLSEDEKSKLWEKAIQQLELILQYKKSDFKGTEDEFQLVQNFARYRVAGYISKKGDLKRAEELLSQVPDDKKYGAAYIGKDLIDEYGKKGNWKKVAELITKYRGQGRVPDLSVNDSFYYEAMRKKEAGKITEALEMLKSLPEPDSKVERLIAECEGELRGEKSAREINKAGEELYLKVSKARKLNQESVMAFDEGKVDLAREKLKAAQIILDEIKNNSPDWLPSDIKDFYKDLYKEIQRNPVYKSGVMEEKFVLPEKVEKKLYEDFQKASLLIREANEDFKDKKRESVLSKSKKAYRILKDIKKEYPDWNSKAVKEKMDECKELFYAKVEPEQTGVGKVDLP